MNFYGIYPACVQSVSDPENRGRVKVRCPYISRDFQTAWCEPCHPIGDFYIPPLGSYVWIAFVEGELSKPVWFGGWFALGETPEAGQRIISYDKAAVTFKDGITYVRSHDETMDIVKEINDLKRRVSRLEGFH